MTSRALTLLTDDLARAADCLRRGGLAALPTETVYGLGALADHRTAVARVYATKGRPADHPLIVHLGTAEAVGEWARDVPGWARELGQACWPGPLTLVLPRSDRAPDFVTAGQGTVGLRVPDHPDTLAVLHAVGTGVAAPSANRFGRVSPTTAQHVVAELGDLLDPARDCILDGGAAAVGVESTIVDCTGPQPRILRPGAVSAQRIAAITGLPVGAGDGSVKAPGTLASHYAPAARVRIVDYPAPADPHRDPHVGLLAPSTVPTPAGVVRLLAPRDAGEYAAGLYAALREADLLGLHRIDVVLPAGAGLAAAVADRVRRAAAASYG